MAISMTALAADLGAETDEVERMLESMSEQDWNLPTPAEGWLIRDQISHLAYFDDMTVLSLTDPERFIEEARTAASPDLADRMVRRQREIAVDDLHAWFRRARNELLDRAAAGNPADRVPWYGPPMSLASSITARIMETWAHGQDIADALGVSRDPSGRLRHVAHIGIGARAYSFQVRGMDVPSDPIRVELEAPDGSGWTWGPADAADQVVGDALEFCLVVTQRRHLADTGLTIVGETAATWMTIAQAFAGPAGPGRPDPSARDTAPGSAGLDTSAP
ncbi:TIGR03084 family metal-binding protein [Sporichthya brevicatena]|uniref:TIGR03084 family metal-binding protein n=1 Tax=Sporichthya brevicatena TaxID=171442 RepID=A0ABP3S1I1_9ACTN